MKIQFKTCYLAVLLTSMMPIVQSCTQESAQQQNAKQTNEAPTPNSISKQAEFPGGEKGLMTYISNELKYPQKLQEQKIEGRTVVSFSIMPDGSINSIQIMKSSHPLFSEEAIRVIKKMPRWSPAVNTSGNNVADKFVLPITFQLETSPKTAK